MTILELLLIAVSLSIDAFTVSICKGLNDNKHKIKNAFIISLFFGLFQGIMPIIGYYLGNIFTDRIIYYNPYISTILLISIGILIFKEDENIDTNNKIKIGELFLLSIATSIDALVIGISFSFLKVNISLSSFIIAIITFIICFIGYFIGNSLNSKISKYSNRIAGIILISLGIKILIQNLLK